jgi:cyclohexyl-isocyanide hydratase
VQFVRRQASAAQWITSVCTGAFILGAAGLLHGKKANCHWAYTHLLADYGAVHVPDRVVRDGNLVTAGGVTSGIDFALTLIANIAGEAVAQSVQLALEYDPAPPFAAGHPSVAPDHIVSALQERVYDAAAVAMADAIAASNQAPQI